MMNAAQTAISHSVPASAGPIPEFSGMIREGASVRKLRLSEPKPSTKTSISSTRATVIAIARQANRQRLEAELEQARVATGRELGLDRSADGFGGRRAHS